MKGVIFTEFLEMVEDHFSLEVADEIIINAGVATGGAYTRVGTYDHGDMVSLVVELSKISGLPADELMKAFGRHLFGRLASKHGYMLEGVTGSLEMLEGVEGHIHVEALKLYPDAELPTFACRRSGKEVLEMNYRSARPFADVAEGLILGCGDFFQETLDIDRSDLENSEGRAACFIVTRSNKKLP